MLPLHSIVFDNRKSVKMNSKKISSFGVGRKKKGEKEAYERALKTSVPVKAFKCWL